MSTILPKLATTTARHAGVARAQRARRGSALERIYARPGFLLKRCHQVAAAIFIDGCRDFGLTPSQYGVLCALSDYPGIDQIALGRLVGLDRSTVGLVIRLLEDRGWIERALNPDDKRRMRLKLSRAGEKFVATVTPAARHVQERVLAGLPRQKREQFLDMLQLFLRGHDAVIDPDAVIEGKPYGSAFDARQTGQKRGTSEE